VSGSRWETLLVFAINHMLQIVLRPKANFPVGTELAQFEDNFEMQRRNLAPDADTTLRLQQISTSLICEGKSTRYMTVSSTPLLA
jgi:hypothetical protein